MTKIFGPYSNFLFGLISSVAFLFTNLMLEHRFILFLSIATIYYIGLSIYLNSKYSSAKVEVEEHQRLLEDLEQKNTQHADFFHKRKIFRQHDLPKIIRISAEQYGYLRDKYRGNKFDSIISEIRISNKEVEKIIEKEMREFDEQLYDVQSYTDT